jgi:AAA+ superfamily predicted ATPase
VTHALALIAETIRLRAARLARFMEALWAEEATSADQGLSITPGEVRRRLLPAAELASARADFEARDSVSRALGPLIERADAALAADPAWRRLVGRFELEPCEAELLAASGALFACPELGRVFAYLADDVSALLPSAALVRRLYDRDLDASLFQGASLRRWQLATCDAKAPIPALAGWQAAAAVVHSLEAGRWRDPLLAGRGVELIEGAPSLPCIQPAAAARAAARLAAGRPADLAGPAGSGRRTLAAQIAEQRGERLLLVDTPRLLAASPDAAEAMTAALRMARYEEALACFIDAAAAPADLWRRLLPAPVGILRCWDPGEAAGQGVDGIALAPIALAERLGLWARLSGLPAPPAVAAARVTVGEIARLAVGAERSGADEPIPELLTRLPTPYGWDDLVLPAETLAAIADFAAQVRLRGAVLEGWGFDRLTHLGSGLVALFAGPSGVGKTMATQVLARELGLDLFRIDLAGVVDKYIGETEKRLRTAFAFAERPGILLLFDEADALFGTRTQAKDSHDRYANLEINYLLQRIETFEGVAVLATNRKSELDAAFRRRLRAMIDFLPPGPAERLRLWQLALPEHAPGGERIIETIDHEMLAERLSLTGADIKAAALGAAFLACAEGSPIAMRHVLAATQREMAKHGQSMRVPISQARTA